MQQLGSVSEILHQMNKHKEEYNVEFNSFMKMERP